MNTQTDIKVLGSLLALHLEVNIWTARKKLSPDDFDGAKLPPDDLASLGSKRVCDPEDLRVFGTLKARAVSLLDRHGVRFLGGWAIPESQADAIVTELEQILQDFNAAKEDFLSRYDESVRDWIAKHSGWEQIIADSTVSADYVRSRMGFIWRLYRIVPPDPADPVMEGLKDEVASAGGTPPTSRGCTATSAAISSTMSRRTSGSPPVKEKNGIFASSLNMSMTRFQESVSSSEAPDDCARARPESSAHPA